MFPAEVIDRLLERDRAKQKLPRRIEDEATLARIAGLLTEPQTARPPSSRLEGRQSGGRRDTGSRLPAA